MEAGAEFSVKPFGLEPQRVLRLEKMHVIVGQDTNAESQPARGGDAVDRQAGQGVATGSAATRWSTTSAAATGSRWSGSTGDNGTTPGRGRAGDRCQRRGRSAASPARGSPSRLGKAIGIAWVPIDLAEEGSAITISDPSGAKIPATRHPQGLLRPRRREAALVTVTDPYAFLSPAAVAPSGSHPPLRTPMERAHLAAGRDARPSTTAGGSPPTRPSRGRRLDRRRARTWASSTCAAPPSELDTLTGGLEPGHGPPRRRGVDAAADRRPTDTCSARFDRVAELRERIGAAAIDITCGMAAVELGGERVARRVHALVRPRTCASRGSARSRCVAGSVMRCPPSILNAGDRLLMLVGWEFGEYFWEAILDAGVNLGIAPASARWQPRRSEEATGMIGPARASTASSAPTTLKSSLRRRHHRRRRARPGHRLLPGQEPRHEERSPCSSRATWARARRAATPPSSAPTT